MSNLTVEEIIKDYRKKSVEYALLADRLQADYGGKNGAESVDARKFDAYSYVPTVPQIKDFIASKKAARAGTIAKELKSTKGKINDIIDANPTVFVKADKGWIKLK